MPTNRRLFLSDTSLEALAQAALHARFSYDQGIDMM